MACFLAAAADGGGDFGFTAAGVRLAARHLGFEIGEQSVEQRHGDLRGVQVACPRLARRAGADHDDVGIGGAVGELHAAGDPGIDGGVDVLGHLRAGLGEVQLDARMRGARTSRDRSFSVPVGLPPAS